MECFLFLFLLLTNKGDVLVSFSNTLVGGPGLDGVSRCGTEGERGKEGVWAEATGAVRWGDDEGTKRGSDGATKRRSEEAPRGRSEGARERGGMGGGDGAARWGDDEGTKRGSEGVRRRRGDEARSPRRKPKRRRGEKSRGGGATSQN
jgi:hypothetical protein